MTLKPGQIATCLGCGGASGGLGILRDPVNQHCGRQRHWRHLGRKQRPVCEWNRAPKAVPETEGFHLLGADAT